MIIRVPVKTENAEEVSFREKANKMVWNERERIKKNEIVSFSRIT